MPATRAAGATLVLPFTSGAALVVTVVVAGLVTGTVWTNTDALISRLAPVGALGVTMGVAGSFKELGDMAGSLLFGAVAQVLGLTAGFISCAAAGLQTLLWVALARRAQSHRR